MSNRFWIISTGVMGMAALAGLSLGAFVTTTPSAVSFSETETIQSSDVTTVDYASRDDMASGPVGPIHCTGCGPTLADRQMMAANAGMDADAYVSGSIDPIVQDYLADEEQPENYPPAPQPARLPVMVERFATGYTVPAPVVRQPVQAPVGAGMVMASIAPTP